MDVNPYQPPDPAGLPRQRSLNPLQHIGVYALAILVVLGYLFIKFGLDAFNNWLFPPIEITVPPEMRQ